MGVLNPFEMKCRHKETRATGIITRTLKATDTFPDQYGIYWDKNTYGRNMPNHYFWNDQSKIEIIPPSNE